MNWAHVQINFMKNERVPIYNTVFGDEKRNTFLNLDVMLNAKKEQWMCLFAFSERSIEEQKLKRICHQFNNWTLSNGEFVIWFE